MREWTCEELDGIIQDLLRQLLSAKAEGWNRVKPAHYRALLAALQIALGDRQQGQGNRISGCDELRIEETRTAGDVPTGRVPFSWRALLRSFSPSRLAGRVVASVAS